MRCRNLLKGSEVESPEICSARADVTRPLRHSGPQLMSTWRGSVGRRDVMELNIHECVYGGLVGCGGVGIRMCVKMRVSEFRVNVCVCVCVWRRVEVV